jgi:hypothetical protein
MPISGGAAGRTASRQSGSDSGRQVSDDGRSAEPELASPAGAATSWTAPDQSGRRAGPARAAADVTGGRTATRLGYPRAPEPVIPEPSGAGAGCEYR